MHDRGRGIIADWNSDDEEVADVMGDAIADALEEHKREGVAIAVWDFDRECVVLVPPGEIVIPNRGVSERSVRIPRRMMVAVLRASPPFRSE